MTTQKKIATKLGVSPSTVSRALRGDGRISDETRRLVEATALEVGYDFRRRRHRPGLERIMVGFLNEWAAVFLGPAILGMSAAASERGVRLVTSDRGGRFSTEASLVSHVEAKGCQAVIVGLAGAGRVSLDKLREVEKAGVTLVLLNRYEGCETNAVTLDDYAAGEVAARYLYDLGHCRIAHVAGPSTFPSFRQRAAGFRDTCRLYGIDAASFIVSPHPEGRWTKLEESGASRLFDRDDPPTAIFAVTDRVAHSVILQAQRRGLRVPEDVAVLGFDNSELAEILGLTSFDFRRFDLGRLAIKLAVELHEGLVEPPIRIALPPRLMRRRSTEPVVELS